MHNPFDYSKWLMPYQ